MNEMLAGAAKVAIPFPEAFFPYRAWGPRKLTGEHDPLCVRALFLKADQPWLLVVIETGDIPPEWNGRLAEAMGMSPSQVLISATHTHTAPYLGSYWPEDVRDPEKSVQYSALAWDAVLEAASGAVSSAVPAAITFGTGSCHVNVNRDVQQQDPFSGALSWTQGQNFHGLSDKTLGVMKVTKADGTPLAVLLNYAVHSSILFGTNQKDGGQLASGDLAGSAMRQIEARLGCVALFTMAPAADQDPRYRAQVMSVSVDGKPEFTDYGMGGYALVDALGREMALETVSVWEGLDPSPLARICSDIGTIWIPGKERNEGPNTPIPKSPADFVSAAPVPVVISTSMLGETLVVGVGCEITTPIGMDIRSALETAGFDQVLIITQCNGSSSYMSDDKGYETMTFTAKASRMMPGASCYLVDGIVALAKSFYT
ncbi:MAG: hypothetical protein IJ206_03985 [Oscillospiraceae bacterium]|nr:hypothetical protein [Oscillospiraceae bacterium]